VSVALVIQHAKRMRRIILSSVACLADPYFPTLSQNRTIFGKKCYWYYNLLQIFLIVWRIKRDIIICVHRSSCKAHVVVFRFYWNLSFLDRFSKNTEISNFIKILVGAELLNVVGRTDILKAIVAFRNFNKAPKNSGNLFSCQGNMDCWRRTVLHAVT
jgi:hypothetical protein